MQWSYRLLRVGDTEIRIHLTFLLLLLWFGIVYFQEGGLPAAIEGVGFLAAVFACVVLHELGHATAARRYGIRTPRITLLPIGGLAELERLPEKPWEEIIVALAGPLVNVIIAAVLILLLGATVEIESLAALENPRVAFAVRLASVNIWLVLFNLIPAFPMDGGRVLRAVLALRMDRVRATEIAGTIGQFAAFAFALFGLISGNVILVLIAVFVYFAATSEARMTWFQDVARTISIGDVLITNFETLAPEETLEDAGRALLRTTQHEFPVVDAHGRLQGVLTRKGLVGGLQAQGGGALVSTAMTAPVPVVAAGRRLEKVLELLQGSGVPAVGVEGADGRLVGYVTLENISEYMLLQQPRVQDRGLRVRRRA